MLFYIVFSQATICKILSSSVKDIANVMSEKEVILVLEDIRTTITKRQDVTLAVFRALETLTVDFAITLSKFLLFHQEN